MEFFQRAAQQIFAIIFLSIVLVGCEGVVGNKVALPTETPEAVVTQFYEFISEAGIRGGTIPIKEAYKMVSSKSQMHEQRFVGIIRKYPPGFKVDVVGSQILKEENQAVVTVEYKMASAFGSGYIVNTDVHLVVDKDSNTWKIDFTGESDDQDVASLKKAQ